MNVVFTISSSIYVFLLLFVFYSKKRINHPETKIFSKILLCTFTGTILEIINYYLLKIGLNKNDTIFVISTKLILIYYVFWTSYFSMYVNIISDRIKLNTLYKFTIPILSIIILMLKINYLNKLNLSIPTGYAVYLVYGVSFVYIILGIIKVVTTFEKRLIKKYLPLLTLIILSTIATIIQFIKPEILLMNFIHTIILYILYFTIENPDIKLSKELKYTKELLNKRNELASNTINNLVISIKEPLTEIANFSNKKINKKNISLSLEEIKELQKTTLSLVDKVNKVMDITRIESSDYSIKERKYQTSNLIDNIKGILEKNNIEVNYEISTLPKVLYGSDINIVQTFSYLVDFISKNFENYTLSIKISNLLVRNKCHLKFSLVVDSKYNNLDMYEKDNKYTLSNKSIEYEIYEKLIDLQRGHNFISKDGSKVIFEFSLYQRQEEVKEINDNEEIEYFDASDKNVLVALNSHNDIRNLSELLMNYNVNITTAGSVNELNELLSSNKTFDLVFLSDHIYGIDNYDIKNTNDFKKTINKLSLVAGYKLEIVLVTLNDYQKENIEYLTLPISKTKLDDVLVKYLNED